LLIKPNNDNKAANKIETDFVAVNVKYITVSAWIVQF